MNGQEIALWFLHTLDCLRAYIARVITVGLHVFRLTFTIEKKQYFFCFIALLHLFFVFFNKECLF